MFAKQLDFKGNEFRAVAFPFYPFSLPDYENQMDHKANTIMQYFPSETLLKNDTQGFEYEIADTVARGLNLRLVVREPTTCCVWGAEGGDGNFTGEDSKIKWFRFE